MFGFSNKSESNKLFERIKKGTVIPMLIDYKPFKEMIKYSINPSMQSLIKYIEDITKEEKAKLLETANLQKEKSRFAAKVLYLSDQLNSHGSRHAGEHLDDIKEKMVEINDKIEQNQIDLSALRVEKENLNLELLRQTLDYCYENINQDEKNLKALLDEIDKIRTELEKKRIVRDTLQKRINSTYGFIHGVMGAKETSKIDEEMLS
ncbi:hypothetical protein FL857_01410 [Criibacterium bergeronii]|uniref:Uncharacterized protein n=1 Tax=Criibacterium bergeronii TaxID=1871336 RepID=A0A552VE68_9FIRM|nr:hypothetical protein [Criibacterium bergeronii]TRW28768.1 hypothetical protein FL857_01410 [Criibacterium bergeronii]